VETPCTQDTRTRQECGVENCGLETSEVPDTTIDAWKEHGTAVYVTSMYELHVRKTLTSLLKFVHGIVRDYAEVEVTWGTFRTLQSLRKQVQETLQPSDDDKNDETIVEVTQGTFNA
jgi:hypothetical protein